MAFSYLHNNALFLKSFFCWLAAWRWPYRGSPWQLNYFIVITLYQQQPNGPYIILSIVVMFLYVFLTPPALPGVPLGLSHVCPQTP